jgi:hypothetical protein
MYRYYIDHRPAWRVNWRKEAMRSLIAFACFFIADPTVSPGVTFQTYNIVFSISYQFGECGCSRSRACVRATLCRHDISAGLRAAAAAPRHTLSVPRIRDLPSAWCRLHWLLWRMAP